MERTGYSKDPIKRETDAVENLPRRAALVSCENEVNMIGLIRNLLKITLKLMNFFHQSQSTIGYKYLYFDVFLTVEHDFEVKNSKKWADRGPPGP